MAISLLMGNGINRLTNREASWEHVLQALVAMNPTHSGLEFVKQKPFALIYEEILLARTTPKTQADEHGMKKRIAEVVGALSSNDFHRRIIKSGTKHILTTNYDYGFEKASGLRSTRTNLARESKYSVFRRREVGSSFVWHIHGEAEVPNSITLGYDQYSGYLQQLRGHATAERDSKPGSPFKRGDYNFDNVENTVYSWLDVFFRDDIHIVGLGLDYTEIDLWWALTYKARLKARGLSVGKTVFHDWHREPLDDQAKAKHSLLRALSVEVVPKQCRVEFETAYDEFIDANVKTAA
jgi:SIR2-like protein